jgi:hypothetical protein
MGFDICIQAATHLSEKTGKPCYMGFSDLTVPEHLRKYIYGRGSHFYAYTHVLEEEMMGTLVAADTFLDNYPSWDDVVKYLDDDNLDYYWNEEDHEKFRELLEWCLEQDCFFNVSWSY